MECGQEMGCGEWDGGCGAHLRGGVGSCCGVVCCVVLCGKHDAGEEAVTKERAQTARPSCAPTRGQRLAAADDISMGITTGGEFPL